MFVSILQRLAVILFLDISSSFILEDKDEQCANILSLYRYLERQTG